MAVKTHLFCDRFEGLEVVFSGTFSHILKTVIAKESSVF